MTSDMINGFFEGVGGFLLWHNCWILYREREVRGVSVFTTAFFTAWGIWNLIFYPLHHLWLSFAGGLVIASANVVWVALALRARRVTTQKRDRMIEQSEVSPDHFKNL